MKMVITDLTRMQPGYICVAGVDPETHKRVRPVLAGGARFTLDWARHHGGIFDFRRIVEIGDATPAGEAPETEDVLVKPRDLVTAGFVKGADFLELLPTIAAPNVHAALGADLTLHHNQKNLVMPVGKGTGSLAIVRATKEFSVYTNETQVRARWPDGKEASVVDLRLYEHDGHTPSKGEVGRLTTRLKQHFANGDAIYLALGLTRPFTATWTGDTMPHHWLQVNSIHLANASEWRLPAPGSEGHDED